MERASVSGWVVLSWVLALAFLSAPPAPGSAQTLRGVVLERGTDRPIGLARTALVAAGDSVVAQTLSDVSGAFSLTSRTAGDFILRATALGYRESYTGVYELGAGGEITVEIRLVPDPLEIEGLTVAPEATLPKLVESGFVERFEGGVGHFLTPADLESGTGRLLVDRLAKIPGVRVLRDKVFLFSRRGSLCVPPVYLDGTKVTWVAGDVETLIGLEDVEAVEVYRGILETPPRFGGMLTGECGALVIWTRRRG